MTDAHTHILTPSVARYTRTNRTHTFRIFRLARYSTLFFLLFDAHPIDSVSTSNLLIACSKPPEPTLSSIRPSLPEPIPASISLLCSSQILILSLFFPISSTRCMRRSARTIRRGCALTTVNPFLLTSFIRVLSSRLRCTCISLIIRSVISVSPSFF